MQITKINVEVKKSWNFQTYTAGEEIELKDKDYTMEEIESLRLIAMTRCRKAVMLQINLDRGTK